MLPISETNLEKLSIIWKNLDNIAELYRNQGLNDKAKQVDKRQSQVFERFCEIYISKNIVDLELKYIEKYCDDHLIYSEIGEKLSSDDFNDFCRSECIKTI